MHRNSNADLVLGHHPLASPFNALSSIVESISGSLSEDYEPLESPVFEKVIWLEVKLILEARKEALAISQLRLRRDELFLGI